MSDDPASLARDLQSALGGGFDPFAMLAGGRRLRAVIIAPFAPAMAEAVAEMQRSGGGPLTDVAKQFEAQGVERTEALSRVRSLFRDAQGLLVVVLADDQGLSCTPTLFFGGLQQAYRDEVARMLGEPIGDRDGLAACLLGLERLAERGAHWPLLAIDAEGGANPRGLWLELAHDLVAGLEEGILPQTGQRLGDLAHWIGRAAADLPLKQADGPELLDLAICHLVAGEIAAACGRAGELLAGFEPVDEDLARFLQVLAESAIRARKPHEAVAFLDQHGQAIDAILGGCYEQALPTFRLLAASAAPSERLLVAAEALQRADRKAFRHDLGREPLWLVAVDDAGELLDTAQAADRIGRSINFVAKRLEHATIPVIRHGDEVRIPARALDAWKAVMDRFGMLDS